MVRGKVREYIPSSFRDPSGLLFFQDGVIYRQVNKVYSKDYDFLMACGLYNGLVDSGLLLCHNEVNTASEDSDDLYKVIRPEAIPFISYPYEWCFSQLKDAALVTLQIQKRALASGMALKDASAYNIQFKQGKPVLIDTLSFQKYRCGEPWVAYRQFCQHFLVPLALMSYKEVRLNQLLRIFIDGIPLDLAVSLLPFHTRLNFSLLSHVHLHARFQKFFADKSAGKKKTEGKMSRLSMRGLIDNLESAVRKMKWPAPDTEWGAYYEYTHYSSGALRHKKEMVAKLLDQLRPGIVWDLGANTGLFSRIAAGRGILTISFDVDHAAVEKNYLECLKEGQGNILPLLLDLTNPSPGIGWENRERASLLERGPAETVLALALIHHLIISNNLPIGKIAEFFSRICKSLIIEFVPKADPQAQRLLLTREDIFPDYERQAFESEFKKYFAIQSSVKIKDCERTLYLMRKK